MVAEPLGIPYTDDLDAVMSGANVYIACVADGALPQVAEKVVALAGESPLYLHTAGSVDISLWRRCGALRFGILYPLQTFSKERAVNMRDVSFFIEASDDKTLVQLEELACRVSRKVFHADSKCRARLHIAAVFACNFVNAMYAAAYRLLDEEGIPFEVLLPLIDETASKVHTLTPHAAQTGPAVRGDEGVMNSHLRTLENNQVLHEIYSQISNYISRE
jgi:predicted short-subunit dehydrogenase-like oxidoreductase (DUF2520 family)